MVGVDPKHGQHWANVGPPATDFSEMGNNFDQRWVSVSKESDGESLKAYLGRGGRFNPNRRMRCNSSRGV